MAAAAYERVVQLVGEWDATDIVAQGDGGALLSSELLAEVHYRLAMCLEMLGHAGDAIHHSDQVCS
eukprot:COSAG01_NODE_686_length_14245_cov_95.096140_17_plen_66_part_00